MRRLCAAFGTTSRPHVIACLSGVARSAVANEAFGRRLVQPAARVPISLIMPSPIRSTT